DRNRWPKISGNGGRSSPEYAIINVAEYISECFRKIRPNNDYKFQAMLADFERTKLRISQELSKALSEYKTVKQEAEKLAKEKAMEEALNSFFKKHDFAIEKKKENKKFLKLIGKKEKLERKIYELCGLIKIGEAK
ncbi:MAG: hypothetical protein KAI26_09455, partial [Nanoarchaeota archaeon]|nr:hypothetical protein [Nanoarchaeota archaeon]